MDQGLGTCHKAFLAPNRPYFTISLIIDHPSTQKNTCYFHYQVRRGHRGRPKNHINGFLGGYQMSSHRPQINHMHMNPPHNMHIRDFRQLRSIWGEGGRAPAFQPLKSILYLFFGIINLFWEWFFGGFCRVPPPIHPKSCFQGLVQRTKFSKIDFFGFCVIYGPGGGGYLSPSVPIFCLGRVWPPLAILNTVWGVTQCIGGYSRVYTMYINDTQWCPRGLI